MFTYDLIHTRHQELPCVGQLIFLYSYEINCIPGCNMHGEGVREWLAG